MITFKIDNLRVPIKLIEEHRRNARAAFGKDAILLRIPQNTNDHQKSRHVEWVKSWLLKTYRKRPKVFERYRPVEYYTGKMINTVLETYTVHLKFVERKTIKANINGYDLSLSIPAHHSAEDKMVGKAVSKAIAKSHQQWFEKRVDFLNDKHFNEEIEAVNLRYAETRWGSCNNRNRISISTRALLAPEKILDHIIIHELAHLKELNHSSAFWGWVSKADPNFREHDKWLKDNGYQLRY